MTDKPTTIVSSTFTPGDGMPTAWEAHAHVLFEQLAGFGVRLGAPALVANGSLIGLFWTLETVTEGRTDLVRLRVSEVQIEMEVYAVGHALADDGKTLDQAEAEALESEAYLDAVTLLGRVVKEVRRFLEARGLVQRVTAYVERLRLDRFFGPADAEGRREALLETVNVDGEAHELLVFDARLADLLEELGQAGWAAKVRSTPAEERGRRWIDLEKHKPLAAMAVCKAVWMRIQAERAARAARLERVPVPTMHALTARVAMGLPTGGNTAELRTRAPGIVAFEAGEWARLGGAAGVLAAVLAQRGHRQWVEGSRTADKVEILASKEELARMGLGNHDRPGETLAQLLELLSSCRLVAAGDPGNLSGALVLDWFVAERPRAGKAGRPSSVYVVTVGWPLMPTYTEAFAAERKLVLPRELRFYGPVLDPATCVLAGNRRTYQAQRLAWSIGAGQWLVSRREEYAERGGVQLDTLRPFLTGMGLYHRSHASLADEVGEAWRRKPVQLELGGPKEPLLVPTGDGLFRLGPDYKEQEKLILAGADLTDRKRAAARQSNKVRRGDVRRKRTDKGPDGV